MKKTAAFLGCLCVFALFSCKKEETATPIANFSRSARSLAVTTVNGVKVNSDTIPPSNAVNVKTYGVIGDGIHDDTQALQAAINAQTTLVLGDTYIINQPLNLRTGVKLYGTRGATIKAGNSMSGKLLTQGQFICIYSCKSVSVINLTFTQSSQSFNLGSWRNSCIYIGNSQNSTITYNRFNFNQPYQPSGIEGVWVAEALTTSTYIGMNTFNTVGIEYCEAGASGTVVIRNTVNNSHSNAICGHGNIATYSTQCQVLNNTVNNAGYNGIVDYLNVDGTIIKSNYIYGSGKMPQHADGEGIQAVGVNTWVSNNYISDAQGEYIEVRSNSMNIDSNTLVDTQGIMQGIVINCKSPVDPTTRYPATTVNHNTISGCSNAVLIVGPYSPSVNIIYNSITNPTASAINIQSNSPSFNVTASRNTIYFTTPNKRTRQAIISYAGTLTSSQLFSITSNTLNYSTSAAGGTNVEYALYPGTNNCSILGNVINSNGIKSGNLNVIALTSNGIKYTGYTISYNTFNGAVSYDISGYTGAIMTGNSF